MKSQVYILGLLLFFLYQLAAAQEMPTGEKSANSEAIILPPLAELVDLALENSPIIKAQKLIIEQKILGTELEKKLIMRALTLNTQYSYGNNSASVNNQIIGTPYTTSTAANFYSGGLFLNLSLFQVAARKESIQHARLFYEIELENMELLKRNTRIEITNLYSDCLLKAKIVEMRREALSLSSINLEYIEKAFKENNAEIQSYSDVMEVHIKMKVAYEQAATEYFQSIAILEEKVGIKIK